jgi:S1-C subfamily serine protease
MVYRNNSKNFFFLLVFLIIASCSQPLTQTKEPEKSLVGAKFEKYREGIIHIGQKKIDGTQNLPITWLGTGFSVDNICTFATAKHIFRNADRNHIVIRFQLPHLRQKVKTIPARILYEDDQTDIAFVKIDEISKKPCQSKKIHSFPLSSDESLKSLVGEPIIIIGHPKLAQKDTDIPILRIGNISSTEILWDSEPMILLDLIGVPGFSGSPVILMNTGHVVGVVYGPGPTARKFGFEWATPITLQHYNQAIE